jgi:hypothetical protein
MRDRETLTAERDMLIRMAEGSLRIAREIEAQAATQRAAAERLYARAALSRAEAPGHE